MREAVRHAHDDEDQRIRHHDDLVAQLIDDATHNGRSDEACHRGNGKQQADHRGVSAVKEDEQIRAEGQEHLLARAVEHLQHVVLRVLAVEVKAALGRIGLALAAHAHAAHRADSRQPRRNREEQLIRLIARDHRERQHDRQIAHQRADLTHGGLHAQRHAAASLTRIAHRQRRFHAQLDVLAQRIDADSQRHEHLFRRQNRLHAHAAQHDDRTCLVQRFCRQRIEHRKDEHQRDARQFAEEFRHAAVHLAHMDDLGQIIIQHALVQAMAQADDENRQQERHIPRIAAEGFPDFVHWFPSPRPKRQFLSRLLL